MWPHVADPRRVHAAQPSSITGRAHAGIDDFRWHDLRHTFATWHRQAGTPTHELQRLGSWKTGAMVERYAHVAPEALQGAALRLDAFFGYAGRSRLLANCAKSLIVLVGRAGLEPATKGL